MKLSDTIETVGLIPIDKIELPRSAIVNTKNIDELKKSIQEHGVLIPLLVRPFGQDMYFDDATNHWQCKGFEVVLGWRRFTIAQELGIPRLLCLISKMTYKQACDIRDTVHNAQ